MKIILKLLTFAFVASLGLACSRSTEPNSSLKVGDPAPSFSTLDDLGQPTALENFKGKYLLLYFYPKDDTPGCTAEAQAFAELYAQFQQLNTEIIGISYDNAASHTAFKKKHELPFPLLIDADKKISEAYGSSGMLVPARDSFLIDPAGKVLKIYRSVDPSSHPLTVLEDLRSLQSITSAALSKFYEK